MLAKSELPILFNGEMVRALHAGKKTQSRRPVKIGKKNPLDAKQLWVRETFSVPTVYDGAKPTDVHPGVKVTYPATGTCDGLKMRPSIHMPRWASRTNLKVRWTTPALLHCMTHSHAVAEGIDASCFCGDFCNIAGPNGCSELLCDRPNSLAAQKFILLWDSIYAKEGFAWKTNPLVWVVVFELIPEETKELYVVFGYSSRKEGADLFFLDTFAKISEAREAVRRYQNGSHDFKYGWVPEASWVIIARGDS